MIRQRFVVVLARPIPARREYVGLFRSVRSAERWATVHAYDGGVPIDWWVEPVRPVDEGVSA